MMMSFEFFQISLFIFAPPRSSLAMMRVSSSRGAFTNVSLHLSLADDDVVVFIIISARKMREFVCILLQSVSNEVFALLLGNLLTRGNFF